eukprot:3325350-Pyramimonas_sp.AAC.1
MVAIINKELDSVGCPSVTRLAADSCKKQVCCLCCVLDKGPDNQGWCNRIVGMSSPKPYFIVWVTWCFMHSAHLICKSVIATLDGWEWGEATEWNGPKYFSSIATVINTWRSPLMPKKLKRAVQHLLPPSQVGSCFRRLPGRALRGRWGSCDSGEEIIISSEAYLG